MENDIIFLLDLEHPCSVDFGHKNLAHMKTTNKAV